MNQIKGMTVIELWNKLNADQQNLVLGVMANLVISEAERKLLLADREVSRLQRELQAETKPGSALKEAL